MKNDIPPPEHGRHSTAPAADVVGGDQGAASGSARHPLLTFTVLTLTLSCFLSSPMHWGYSRAHCWPRARFWRRSSPQPWSEEGKGCAPTFAV